MRFVVVGGGILGLAAGRLLVRTEADAEVIVLEKELSVARHQSGHNSGVAHAGLYYAPGSLKARLCRRGIGLLHEFCAEQGLGYDRCGKLVIACEERELAPLRALAERASRNGVPQLRWVEGAALTAIEPHARGLAALHSPETAIVDFAAVARALAAEIVAGGGEVRLGTEAARVIGAGGGASGRVRVELSSGGTLDADRVIVCAGLHADRLARASGEPASPRLVPFRGEYWQLRPERTDLVNGLIYPVPDPGLPFLGVHLTRRLDGGVLIGPNAVIALSRDGYRRRTVNLRDLGETVSWPGTRRMARRHWRAGVAELARSASRRAFIAGARRYVPELEPADLVAAPAGVRAQAIDRDGSLIDDFRLNLTGGVVWVRNAPSPAATSSLAIAEELVARALAPTSAEAVG